MNIYEANMKPIKAIREAYDVEVHWPGWRSQPIEYAMCESLQMLGNRPPKWREREA